MILGGLVGSEVEVVTVELTACPVRSMTRSARTKSRPSAWVAVLLCAAMLLYDRDRSIVKQALVGPLLFT
jgi:hypothetical protein